MIAEDGKQEVPRLTFRIKEAAEALGMSDDSFARHVRPFIRTIRCDRLVLIPVKELEGWVAQSAACVGSDWS